MIYLLFNPLANNHCGEKDAKAWATKYGVEAEFMNLIGLDFKKFFDSLNPKDEVILTGGDGTVNHFANDTYGYQFKNPLFYAKCGSGNDFFKDVEAHAIDGKINLIPFLKDLPIVTIGNISRRFVNGIGYGIDGETCLAGDQIRKANPTAPINYTKIAIGLILGKFKSRRATIEVDGKKYSLKNVWIASSMFGRFYGGGMMAAPKQDRLNHNHCCTVTSFTTVGRIATLLRFSSFSSGKHEKKSYIKSFVGHNITVSFDQPCALQVDGEVIANVSSYSVRFGDIS